MNTVWKPKHPEKSQMWAFMRFSEQKTGRTFSDYHSLHKWSVQEPEVFWLLLCDFFNIRFDTPADSILSQPDEMEKAEWFSGAAFNFSRTLLSRRDEHPAIIAINESGKRELYTYEALYKAVEACQGGLKNAGVGKGDRVAAILPNSAYAIIAMLATASLGAIWSSCSTDFGADAAIDRLEQIDPVLLFSVESHRYGGKIFDNREKLQAVSHALPQLKKIVLCPDGENTPSTSWPKTCLWKDFMVEQDALTFASLPFAHPLYILFSSGTTGKPKCIVHGAGGTLLQHVKELGLHSDIQSTDNLFFYTTCGWMMWNWMVSALALGTTLTLYDGSPFQPNASRIFQILEEEKVSVFGTGAKFISSLEKMDAVSDGRFDLHSLKTILSTGSPLLPANYDFVYKNIKKDVQLSSISGGTDIVSCFALGNPLLPVHRGELQCFGLGMAIAIYNDEGKPVVAERGELVCTRPFPSMPVFFWQDKEGKAYHKAYFNRFKNVWAHGDFAEETAQHGLIIYGRSDAVLNPGGIRIGTAEIYRQIEAIPEILDSVVIGQNWEDDVRVVLFVKLQENLILDDRLRQLIKNNLRQKASPRHVPDKILQVQDIPRTISGKVVELAVRQTVHGETVGNLQSLANPEALEYFKNRPELMT